MLRALGFRSKPAELPQEESVPLILKQAHDFELALKAMDYLLDDRTNEGLHLIEDDTDSAIKTLALGVIRFLEATLGFEPEVMRKASDILSHAETLSSRERSKNQNLKLKTSGNFPPGLEYAVTYAESNLLNALIMLLSESMIESAKALYKLRKAYQTLDEIFKHIKEYEKKKGVKVTSYPNESTTSFNSTVSGKHYLDIPFPLSDTQLKDDGLHKIAGEIATMRISRLRGAHIGNTPASDRLRSTVGYTNTNAEETEQQENEKESDSDSDSATESKFIEESESTIDEFIISGSNLCFGILQLVLSLIPPAIGKVLAIVGFKGSREQGLKMIWKSVARRNIHGCIGLLALLVFYDGPFQFTDSDFDIPDFNIKDNKEKDDDDEASSSITSRALSRTRSARIMRTESRAFQGIGEPTVLHPGKKLEDALLYARALFPNSALWLLQEARMLTSRGRLEEALSLMESIDRKIEMKQVEALLLFDKVMILIFLHKFEKASETIVDLLKVNEWSPGLYTYASGCCYLEIYRMGQMGLIEDKEQLKKMDFYKEQAVKLIFKDAPKLAKSGKIMSKQMPFDKFLCRKVSQFEAISKKYNLPLIDSIGTSPIHELSYFWNGYNRMPEDHLILTDKLLNYSASDKYAKFPEPANQKFIRNLLQSITYRRLGQIDRGMKIMDEQIIPQLIELGPQFGTDGYKYIKQTDEDPWAYPTALYEYALFKWKAKGVDGLDESKDWLRRAVGWSEDYELSTRIGMKIKAALDRLEGL